MNGDDAMKDSRAPRRLVRARRWAHRFEASAQAGMATAEYAIGTLAAVGFAGLLLVILKSDQVRAMLVDLVSRALSIAP